MPEKPNNFWQELKRRKVIRVIIGYAAASYVILELISIIAEPFSLPEWTLRLVFILLCTGFIITIILSWIYDVTPEGIKKTTSAAKLKNEEGKPRKKKLKASDVIISILLVAVIVLAYPRIFKKNKSEPEGQSWTHSIVVMPFADMSPNRDQEFFCDGMAEEIINALTNVDKLRVIARTSAFSFKGKNIDVRTIGDELGVANLLEGSVRKSGDQLRVTTQLVRTSDGTHLWSEQYNRNLTDVFTIQEEIALSVVDHLKMTLLGDEEERIKMRLTDNLEAYHLYLRGRHILNRRKKEDIYTAIDYFKRALELDSLYVMGYIGLADAYALLPSYAAEPEQQAYPRAKAAINRALEISDQVGEAYASQGWIRMLADWDWKGAEEAFRKAISLNPGYATAYHWYGYFYMLMGDMDKSIPIIKKALDLDPLSPVINRVMGDVYYHSHQYDEAITPLQKTLELEPCMPFAHMQLSLCYLQKSMYDEAIEEFEKEKQCREDPSGVEYILGLIYVKMGDLDKAREILRELENRNIKGYGTAQLYFALGENENGFKMLEEMYENHDTWLIFIRSSAWFDNVRSLPRFKNLIKKIGLD
jgi:adenylate cyclase